MPPDKRNRPADNRAALEDDHHGDGFVGYRVRRLAALRCEPLACGHRDPLDCLIEVPRPSTFGLTRRELLAEIDRCKRVGWQRWELRQVFVDPRALEVAA